MAARGPGPSTFLPALGGFALFFLMEQFLAWHHAHSAEADAKAPVTFGAFVGGISVIVAIRALLGG